MLKKKKVKVSKTVTWLKSRKGWITLGIIFATFLLLHLYQFDLRTPFRWDQVDFAWAAQQIIVAGDYPLVGMAAKGNSGFNVGPAYYYFTAPFYALFNMSPVAAAAAAFTTSLISFFTIFFVVKRMFSFNIALITVFINTVSYYVLTTDRSQWSVNFIIPVSLLIFYALHKIITGEVKYLLLLAVMLGVSLHIHFTSVFYFIAVLLSLPFFPRKKKTLLYILYSIPLFTIWILPMIYHAIISQYQQEINMTWYLKNHFHGLYITRILQLTHDAFIEFNLLLRYSVVDYFNFLLPPIFAIVYYLNNKSRKSLMLIYLMALWFLIPWLAFSTYSGEITNYYFYMTRPMVLIILAYLTYRLYKVKSVIPKIALVVFWGYFVYTNVSTFLTEEKNYKADCGMHQDERPRRNTAKSYLYYYCTQHHEK